MKSQIASLASTEGVEELAQAITLSVVIPVYNERDTIEKILERVQKTSFQKEIIIVDDGSSDGTREILKNGYEDSCKVIFHERNRGKGAALQTGFNHVTGDIVIIQDADLEYDPADYAKLIDPIIRGKADVVFGSRFLSGPHRVLFFWHYMGNKLLTLFSNMLNNINLSDMETCYKAFSSEVLKTLQIRSQRFGFEPEFTAKVARRKLKIYEVPISYYGRTYDEGKKITWKDGISALYCIIKFRFVD